MNTHNQKRLGTCGQYIWGYFSITAGSAMVITSVPVFIRSGYYKRKAMDMSASIKLEPYQSGLAVKHFPSMSD